MKFESLFGRGERSKGAHSASFDGCDCDQAAPLLCVDGSGYRYTDFVGHLFDRETEHLAQAIKLCDGQSCLTILLSQSVRRVERQGFDFVRLK